MDRLYVSSMRSESTRLKVEFDISFPEISCGMLSVDVLDDVGAPQLDALHDIYKFRILPNGAKDPNSGTKVELGNTVRTEADLKQVYDDHKADLRIKLGDECGDCYGAADHAAHCCNTCDDVKQAYERKGESYNYNDALIRLYKIICIPK